MEDIRVDGFFGRLKYFISWFGFIFGGVIIVWIIALLLANYGKITSNNVRKEKGLLNKTWQKFVYIYGLIVGTIIILHTIIMFFVVAKVAGLW